MARELAHIKTHNKSIQRINNLYSSFTILEIIKKIPPKNRENPKTLIRIVLLIKLCIQKYTAITIAS